MGTYRHTTGATTTDRYDHHRRSTSRHTGTEPPAHGTTGTTGTNAGTMGTTAPGPRHHIPERHWHDRIRPARWAPPTTGTTGTGTTYGNGTDRHGTATGGGWPRTTTGSATTSTTTGTLRRQHRRTSVSGGTSQNLPRTASDMPLVGLIGGLALAGALGLRSIR